MRFVFVMLLNGLTV